MPLSNPPDPGSVSIIMKGTAGGPQNNLLRMFTALYTLSGTNGSGYPLDISMAGFSAVTSIQINAINNTSSLIAIPIVTEKTRTPSTVTVNIITINMTQVTALLQTVAGAGFATNLVGMQIDLAVQGY